MPYIKQQERVQFDELILPISDLLRQQELTFRKGPLNYIISRLVLQSTKPESGWSYCSISNAVSVLQDAATEMERRLMWPHEDRAIQKNGDLPEYAE